jgi:hypothetical protein
MILIKFAGYGYWRVSIKSPTLMILIAWIKDVSGDRLWVQAGNSLLSYVNGLTSQQHLDCNHSLLSGAQLACDYRS